MKTGRNWFGFTLLLASATAVVRAQAPVLDVKMGLWEITSVTDIGGQMPAMDMSKMTPAQQAQMETVLKGVMGQHTNVGKSCVTKEKFDKGDFMMQGDEDMKCQQTLTTNTKTALDVKISCTGDHAMTGQMHVDALSPTSIKANMKSANTENGRTMTMNIAMTGKWLGADCGNVD